MVKYFDAFAGIGGFSIPLLESGAVCVGYSEIDRFAAAIYRRHFPKHEAYGDIAKIQIKRLPDFDLLVAGFPCQAFSVAGRRRGFLDTRGTLFFELARILRGKRPRFFLFENVRGLLSHDGGQTCKAILSALEKLGYDLQWQVLNSKDFGVPQNRERIYLVGNSRTSPRPQVFPLAGNDGPIPRQHSEGCQGTPRSSEQASETAPDSMSGIDSPSSAFSSPSEDSSIMPGAPRTRAGQVRFEVRNDGLSNALRTSSGGSSRALIAYRGRAVNEPDRPARTLKAGCHGVPGGDGLVRYGAWIRRLTPLECERLQGFPDRWTESGVDENGSKIFVSDTQRYKCLGNAVTVCVVRAIMARFAERRACPRAIRNDEG